MTTAPGVKRDSATSSQCPLGPVGRRSTSLPPIVLTAIGHPAVVVDVRGREPAAVQPQAAPRTPLGVAVAPRAPPEPARARDRLGVRLEVRDRDRACREDEVGRAGVREVDEGGAPAGEGAAERRVEVRPRVRERRRRRRPLRRRPTARRASSSRRGRGPGRPPATTHAGERVGDAVAAARSSKRKPSPAGSALAPPGHGHVLVELVRVLVVRRRRDPGGRRRCSRRTSRRARGGSSADSRPACTPTSRKRPCRRACPR